LAHLVARRPPARVGDRSRLSPWRRPSLCLGLQPCRASARSPRPPRRREFRRLP
jgi:hypothetical protein